MVETSPLPALKYSFSTGRNTPKLKRMVSTWSLDRQWTSCYLYITPSPMTLPMKQARTANHPQSPPSGAAGGDIAGSANSGYYDWALSERENFVRLESGGWELERETQRSISSGSHCIALSASSGFLSLGDPVAPLQDTDRSFYRTLFTIH